MSALTDYILAGYTPASAIDAVKANNPNLLRHTSTLPRPTAPSSPSA